MTDPNWKPQPGKPAMTRDKKTLVTDLVPLWSVIYSKASDRYWFPDGRASCAGGPVDLIEPTTAILAAHGIDADGKPVAKVAQSANVDVTNEEYGRKHITAEHGRCGLCFYADLEHLGSLECRRFPPAPYFEPAGKVSNIRPRVGAYYWCGEFKEKPAPEVAKREGR